MENVSENYDALSAGQSDQVPLPDSNGSGHKMHLKERRSSIKKTLIFTGKLLISATLLWFVFSKIDIRNISLLIQSSDMIWFLPALIFFVLSKLVSAYRLNSFFRAAGLHIHNNINIRLYLLGMFYNLFLPGGVGGDAYKIILLNRHSSVRLKHIFHATLLDRITGLVALVIIAIMLSWWLPLPQYYHLISALSIPAIIITSYFAIRALFPIFAKIFTRTNLQSAVVQLLQLCSALCILWAIRHHDHTILLLTLFLVSSVMAVIPLTFGGAGAREFTFAVAGTLMAFESNMRDAAITLGLIFYLITAVSSLAGVWYLFVPIRITEKEVSDCSERNKK